MGIDNPVHLIFIAAVALIVLGPKRLPELARSLGHGIREFRESMSEAVNDGDHTAPPLVPQQAQLIATSEQVSASPADVVIVDPAAPRRAATAVSPDAPVPADAPPVPADTPGSSIATTEAVERPSSPPAS
jgi:sec-independent protein translocase protein TatA